MVTPVVALVTDEESRPEDYDMDVLVEACTAIGLRPIERDWRDPAVVWAAHDVVVIRSPWSYTSDIAGFVGWVRRVSRESTLLNSADVLEWSLDKRYMRVLADSGVPIVPTLFADSADSLGEAFGDVGSRGPEIVIKPRVGAYSRGVRRMDLATNRDAAYSYALGLVEDGGVLIQPYLHSVVANGEVDLVFFDGVFSHAFHKAGLLKEGAAVPPTQDVRSVVAPARDQLDVAEKALAAVASLFPRSSALAYARVDVVRDGADSALIHELELCEPSLSLNLCLGSAAKFSAAIEQRVE